MINTTMREKIKKFYNPQLNEHGTFYVTVNGEKKILPPLADQDLLLTFDGSDNLKTTCMELAETFFPHYVKNKQLEEENSKLKRKLSYCEDLIIDAFVAKTENGMMSNMDYQLLNDLDILKSVETKVLLRANFPKEELATNFMEEITVEYTFEKLAWEA